MRLSTGEFDSVRSGDGAFRLPWQHEAMIAGRAFGVHHESPDACEKMVMNKLERLAAELRALGIEF